MIKPVFKFALISTGILASAYLVFINLFIVCDMSSLVQHKVKIDIEMLSSSVELYEKDNGIYPSVLDQLKGEYVKKIPQDPWGNRYLYINNGSKFIILSHGDPSNDQAIYQISLKET
ncbi:MAG: hypothetical protein ACJATK_001572 [Paracoccaceae bacterium]|jgi:hypothetical protein